MRFTGINKTINKTRIDVFLCLGADFDGGLYRFARKIKLNRSAFMLSTVDFMLSAPLGLNH